MNRTTIAALAIVLCLCTGCSRRSGEPSANGRPLRDWVFIYASTGPTVPQHSEAESAIRKIGTNAIPFLVRYIAGGQPSVPGEFADAESPNTMAMATPPAFSIFGAEAQSAIAPLTQMLTNWNANISPFAGTALGRIGQTALPALMTAATNQNHNVSTCAVQSILLVDPSAFSALPLLRSLTNNAAVDVREAATLLVEVLERKTKSCH